MSTAPHNLVLPKPTLAPKSNIMPEVTVNVPMPSGAAVPAESRRPYFGVIWKCLSPGCTEPAARDGKFCLNHPRTRFTVRKVGQRWYAVDYVADQMWERNSWQHAFNCLRFAYDPEFR
jgi:hypothetical protein